MQDFKKLKVWEKAHELTLDIYKISNNFPKEEIYALTSQIRRASASIGLNIAEGSGRSTVPDFKHFLVMAMGSINEVEYCLILAFDLQYIKLNMFTETQQKIEEVRKILTIFMSKIK